MMYTNFYENKDYNKKNINDIAYSVLFDSDIKTLPINLNKIVKKFGIKLLSYIEDYAIIKMVDEKEKHKNVHGFSMNIENKNIICYDEIGNYGYQRFTISHELGHYFLGHIDKINTNNNYVDKEKNFHKDANAFACALLCPLCILKECEIFSTFELINICGISNQFARNTFNRIKTYIKTFEYYSTLECYLISKFENFIKHYHDVKSQKKKEL